MAFPVGALHQGIPGGAVDARLRTLVNAVWFHDPPRIVCRGGRYRWRDPAAGGREVSELIAHSLGPGAIPIDVSQAKGLGLPPTGPWSHPARASVYPFVLQDPPAGSGAGAPTVYLWLFYSRPLASAARSGQAAERERIYYRVIETLDRLHSELAERYPSRPIRPIDLPMPGWMEAAFGATEGNYCPLLPS